MTKRDFLRCALPWTVAGMARAQTSVYIVVSITLLDAHRADVKLKNPRTGYVHSVTALRSEIASIKVGDRVRELRSVRDVRIDLVESQLSPTPRAPDQRPIRMQGRSDHRVWSGYWWPDAPDRRYQLFSEGGPLDLYERLTGDDRPRRLEAQYHGNPPAAQRGWTGHCDGFSVSSALYPEPLQPVRAASSARGPVVFQPAHLKGLLAVLWSGYDWSGTGRTAGGPQGIAAADFHRFVLFYIGANRFPLVVNTRKDAVWNYPCDEFAMEATPDVMDQWRVTMRLSLADDAVAPNFQGKKELEYVNQYDLLGDPRDIDSIRWAGWVSPDTPGWVFSPHLGNAGGVPVRPRKTTGRYHPYIDEAFRGLLAAMARVSSGERATDRWGAYTIGVAA